VAQFLIYLIFIVVLVLLAVLFMRKAKAYHFYIKKSLHISVILMCAHASVYLPIIPLFIIVSIALILLSWAIIFKGFLSDPITKEKEWGVLYFVGVFVLMLSIIILKNQQELRVVTSFSLTILAISDGLAGMIGRGISDYSVRKKENQSFLSGIKRTSTNDKSITGFLAFVLSSFGIIYYYLNSYTNYALLELLIAAWVLSFVLGITEFNSKKGSDNFTVTLFAFLLLSWLKGNGFEAAFLYKADQIFFLGFISIVLLIGLYRIKFLTFSGSISAWLLAFVVMILAKHTLVPLLVFLLLGSIIGKLPVKDIVSDERFHQPRNASQVFANAGVVFLLGLLFWGLSVLGVSLLNHQDLQKLMLVSVAICMADTISSEIGSRFGGIPKDLLTYKPLSAGVSGGVTLLGTLSGLFGSLLIITIGSYQISMSLYEFFVFVFLGFLGMLIDSIIGSKFQYKVEVNGKWQDSSTNDLGHRFKGLKFISNNTVNFISNLLIICILTCILLQ
jgi:uncharacterized protein (TIGR00297 family)